MKRINFFSFVLISLLLILLPFESVSADEERSLDPEDLERSLYSFQSYQGDKWYFDAIDTPNSNNTGANVTIAILDTGVTKTSQLACHNFVNEYDAFWNISGPGSARDIGSHGTLVAHTIADCDTGIAKSVNIMPVRIFTDYFASYGYPTYTDDLAVAMGIVWAVDNGADIINMSFGASCFTTWDGGCNGQTGDFAGYVDGAIKYAYDSGVLLLAASGNDALPWVSYPANNPYVWAIGAISSSLNKASFSNFGSALDFVAPGENIGTALGTVQGTSFSSPEVAAAAAVLKGSMPGLSLKEIEGAFICTVVDLGNAGWDPEYGWGMIQIEASLNLLNAGLLQTPWFPTPSLTLVSEGQGKIKAIWQPADDCNGIDSYSLYNNGNFINSYDRNKTEGYITVSESGTYSLSVQAKNIFNNTTEIITSTIDIDLLAPNFESNNIVVDTTEGIFVRWDKATDSNGVDKYQIKLNDSLNRKIREIYTDSTEIVFDTFDLVSGEYSIAIYAYDIYNNISLPITINFSISSENIENGTSPSTTSTTTTIPPSTTTSSTTTTILEASSTPTGTISGDCPLLASSTSATSPLFKSVNSNVFPMGPVESAFAGYEGCMYKGYDREQIKQEIIRYLDYWKEFDRNEFKNLESVKSRNWRNIDALNAAADRWSAEWSGINSNSIVENLSRSDGQLVWDDKYWTGSVTTTTLPTYSDPNTTNTVLGPPTITSITITGTDNGNDYYNVVIGFNFAPAVKGLEIVGHSLSVLYPSGGTSGTGGLIGVDTQTISSDRVGKNRGGNQLSFKINASYGNYVNCGTDASGTCVKIDNQQTGPFCEWVTVTLSGPGYVNDPNVILNWDGASTETTTTTVPDSGTTTTTTLPPANTTTTTLPCKTLDEAKSLWIEENVRLKTCAGCVPKDGTWIIDSGGSQTALVNGTSQNVSQSYFDTPLSVGDTFLSGEKGEAGLLLWTHTVTEARSGTNGGRAEYTPVYPDSEVERFAKQMHYYRDWSLCP